MTEYLVTKDELARYLSLDPNSGLTEGKARENAVTYGSNSSRRKK